MGKYLLWIVSDVSSHDGNFFPFIGGNLFWWCHCFLTHAFSIFYLPFQRPPGCLCMTLTPCQLFAGISWRRFKDILKEESRGGGIGSWHVLLLLRSCLSYPTHAWFGPLLALILPQTTPELHPLPPYLLWRGIWELPACVGPQATCTGGPAVYDSGVQYRKRSYSSELHDTSLSNRVAVRM